MPPHGEVGEVMNYICFKLAAKFVAGPLSAARRAVPFCVALCEKPTRQQRAHNFLSLQISVVIFVDPVSALVNCLKKR
jgi:hypothetical protein